jgi:hypothetical protein
VVALGRGHEDEAQARRRLNEAALAALKARERAVRDCADLILPGSRAVSLSVT